MNLAPAEISAPVDANPVSWLLGEDNPSVRYFTLLHLLKLPPTHPEVLEAKRRIMRVGLVPAILDQQRSQGHWGQPEDFYLRSKYKGTVWTLLILAELGASGDDRRIRKACEFILTISQDRDSGGFATRGTTRAGGDHQSVIPCLTGNLVWALIRFGYLDDPRVQHGIEWITRWQRFDDGLLSHGPAGWPYERHPQCWGRHSCHMGVVKTFKALAEIPAPQRSKSVTRTLDAATEYLLRHHIFKRSHDLSQLSIPAWLQFGFPRMWDTDTLEVLGILTRLDCQDGRMRDAIDLVQAKQNLHGRWLLEDGFDGRFLVHLEKPGHPSKWISLHALCVLQAFYSWKAFTPQTA